MSEYTIWWIDDKESREEEASALEEMSDEISVEFNQPSDAQEQLTEDDKLEIDLILIDWMLDVDDHDYTGKGLSMEAAIRERFSSTPIYGFSAEFDENVDNELTRDRFDDVFPLSEFNSGGAADRLIKDIDDYRSLNSAQGENFDSLLDLLDAPEDEKENLRAGIPRDFDSGIKEIGDETKGGNPLEFAKWVRTRFLTTPGPLWNDLWTATKVGLDEDAFESCDDTLLEVDQVNIRYTGIFSHRIERRWWSSQVIGALIELNDDPENRVTTAREAGPRILEHSSGDTATCKCGQDLPETLAAVKPGKDADIPVHYRCSDIHHSREGPFEDYRVISDK